MTKSSGLGDNLYIGQYDLSGDIGSLGRINTARAPLNKTGIDKSGVERTPGIRDGGMEFRAHFNKATAQEHPVLAALPRTNVIASYFRGTVAGNAAASMTSKQLNYDGERNEDGDLRFKVVCESTDYGLDWGRMLTAGKRTDTAATNGTSLDYGAAVGTTVFGLQLYVHLFTFTGTSVTVKVQCSTDNGAGDAFADITGATSGALTAVGSVRAATATNASVERYLRIVTTGTFTNAVFAVNVIRNDAVPAF